MKILIDSDVCLDFITGRRPHFPAAQKLFSKIEHKAAQAVISPHSFSNMFYILRSQYKVPNVITSLKNLRLFAGVGALAAIEIDRALDSGWADFEDAMQYHCAKENGCNAIITRNRKDFTHAELQILSPRQFLAQLQ